MLSTYEIWPANDGAYSVNLIPSVPKFPSIKVTSKPRGSFSLAECRLLARTASRIAGERVPITTTQRSKRGKEHVDRYAEVTRELHWLIRFMVNSFVRPSDIKNLQHKHVTVVRGKHTYLRLNLPESKLHDKPIVTLAPAVASEIGAECWKSSAGSSSTCRQWLGLVRTRPTA